MTNDQFERLPRYARIEIENLRDGLDQAARMLEEMQPGGTEDSRTVWSDYTTEFRLPNGGHIEFHIPGIKASNGMEVKTFVRVEVRDNALGINSSFGRLSVRPNAANDIDVEVVC